MAPEEIREYCDGHEEIRAVVIRADAASAAGVLRFGDLDDLR